jgi:hypothetical protein
MRTAWARVGKTRSPACGTGPPGAGLASVDDIAHELRQWSV